jgi:hypothetical protein
MNRMLFTLKTFSFSRPTPTIFVFVSWKMKQSDRITQNVPFEHIVALGGYNVAGMET